MTVCLDGLNPQFSGKSAPDKSAKQSLALPSILNPTIYAS
jgi:hypothetical protein